MREARSIWDKPIFAMPATQKRFGLLCLLPCDLRKPRAIFVGTMRQIIGVQSRNHHAISRRRPKRRDNREPNRKARRVNHVAHPVILPAKRITISATADLRSNFLQYSR